MDNDLRRKRYEYLVDQHGRCLDLYLFGDEVWGYPNDHPVWKVQGNEKRRYHWYFWKLDVAANNFPTPFTEVEPDKVPEYVKARFAENIFTEDEIAKSVEFIQNG